MARSATTPLDAYTIIPMESFSAFRKAILSMKDLGTFVTLRMHSPTALEVSSMDDFRGTGLYTVVPVFRTTHMPNNATGFLSATDLVTLASILKKHTGAIRLMYLAERRTFRVTKLNSYHALLEPGLTQPDCLHSRLLELVQDQDYYWIEMVSVDILNICVNLCVGSAAVDVLLLSDGRLIWSTDSDVGKISATKQLSTQFIVSSTSQDTKDPTVYVLSKTQHELKENRLS